MVGARSMSQPARPLRAVFLDIGDTVMRPNPSWEHVYAMAFEEFRNSGFLRLADRGLEFFDLEYDVKAFRSHLPRVRVIPIDEFDPADFL